MIREDQNLERSAGFEKKLEDVRRMPQTINRVSENVAESAEINKQNAEKREAAKLLRMEALFDNAYLAKFLTDDFVSDPEEYEGYDGFAKLKELAKQKSGRIIHPEAVQAFIDQLQRQKIRASLALDSLKREAVERGVDLGEILFRILANDPEATPNGEVSIDDSYPLGIIVYVQNKDDFARVDPRINISGFYDKAMNYTWQKYDYKRPDTFPVLVVESLDKNKWLTDRENTVRHEKGHAENDVFIKSLPPGFKKAVWTTFDDPPYESANRIVGNEHLNLNELVSSPDYKSIISYSLAHAKDELLADYGISPNKILERLQVLIEKAGVYDYFSNHLNIPKESSTHAILWQEYSEVLTREVASIMRLVETYQNSGLLSQKRLSAFKWILAQIPLHDWTRQLSETKFFDEAEVIARVGKIYKNYCKLPEYDNDASPATQEVLQLEKDLRNENRPLFDTLENFERNWQGIKK